MAKLPEDPAKVEQTREYDIYGQMPDPTDNVGDSNHVVRFLATQTGRNHADALRQWGRANPESSAEHTFFLVVTASSSKVLGGQTRQDFVVS